MRFKNQGFDHVEFVVRDAKQRAQVYEKLGFIKIGERSDSETHTLVYGQGFIRILLTEAQKNPSSGGQSKALGFLNDLDEGITVLAVEVDDCRKIFDDAVKKGARPCMEPTRYESSEGKVTRAEVWTPGKVRYAFIERQSSSDLKKPMLLDKDLVVSVQEAPSPLSLRVIDHLTNNVNMGEFDTWVDYYQRIFGFKSIRHFDIRTGRTGLISEAMQSECGKVTIPINVATEKESQVQEFVDRLGGAGVQHLAFLSLDIISTLKSLKKVGLGLLTVPATYYEAVPKRVKKFDEDLEVLKELGILIDSEGEGYLLQIFSEEIVGPFFFEFIQRKGNRGFGEGNFKALFEAIERDQIQRGVLKPS